MYFGYGLVIIAFIITLLADIYLRIRYSKYKKVKVKSGMTGAEVAREILKSNGLDNVYVVETKGYLTDHYDPKAKVVRLSTDIYNGDSIASVSVAAHECGHAVQDKDGYFFLRFRSFLVPIVNFSSKFGYLAILIGLIFGALDLAWVGIFLLVAIVLFQLITLPVELNASKRGKMFLTKLNVVEAGERSMASSMLMAAAMTYVASLISTLLELLRLVLIVMGNDRD
jgi:hypothetical protein